jgi:asparagine synthase (glutamine-hydrolysing)
MCRIAGITSNKLQLNEIRAKVIAMGNSLKHGGPDDVGLFLDEKVKLAFGHRRLSIIDLSKNL